MRLGAIIKALEAYDSESQVRIAGPTLLYPLELSSYRGYYEDLAIDYTDHEPVVIRTVRTLTAELRAAIGQTFTGYKGGGYTATMDTIVWVSHWGTSSGALVDQVYQDDGVTFIGVRMNWSKT